MYKRKNVPEDYPTVHFRLKKFYKLFSEHSTEKCDDCDVKEILKHLTKSEPKNYFVYLQGRDKVRFPDNNSSPEDSVSLRIEKLTFLDSDLIQKLVSPLSSS